MSAIWPDLIFTFRTMRTNRGYAAVVVLILALGIGANSAIYSIVNAVILRPLPYASPDRLMMLPAVHQPDSRGTEISVPTFLDWQRGNRSFEHLGGFAPASFNLTGRDLPERIQAAQITPSALAALGTKPLLGRLFLPEEEPGDAKMALLSYQLWKSHFAGAEDVVGKTIQLGGVGYPIVGVMPPQFEFPNDEVRLWVPVPVAEWSPYRGSRWLYAMGRLKDGVSLEAAQDDMDNISRALAEQYPRSAGWGAQVLPMAEHFVGDVRPALLILLTTVLLLLLVGCTNIATLGMARAATRRTEMAIRSAMGASVPTLLRQLIVEAVVLAMLGGALGLLLAHWSLRLLIALSPKHIPRVDEIGIDGNVLLFTLGISLLTALVFGLLPGLSALKPDLVGDLREGARTISSGGAALRFRRLLTAGEVAIALVLLISAILLVSSLLRLQRVEPGFNPENVLTMELVLPWDRYPEAAQRTTFFRQLAERASQIPGVEAAGGVSNLPLGGSDASESYIVEDHPPENPDSRPEASFRGVTPGYFRALEIPLLQGRDFSSWDAAESPTVAIVNKTFADRYWPDESPLGKRIAFTGGRPEQTYHEVIGVVGDVRHTGLDTPTAPEIYVTYEQHNPWDTMVLTVKTKLDQEKLARQLRAEVASMDSQQPVFNVRTMEEVLVASTSEPRLYTTLLSAFAALALILSALGLYSIISYFIANRQHEIGIRVALGAQRVKVLQLVVWEGLLIAAMGIVSGLVMAYIATRAMSKLLFGIRPDDPATFAGAAVLLAAVALVASFIPALRASRVSPMTTLRAE